MDVNNLLEQLAPLVKEYEEKKKKRMDTGFNVFYLISDYYYRETFHGDILYALLSPEEKHGEGNLFIHLFIDMINKAKPLKDKSLVDTKYYDEVSVNREYGTNDGNDMGRIDLLVIGQNNHCIVIENKLNNAGDTYRQLPKYRKYLKEKGYNIDAFVYVPLNPDKWPDYLDWSEDEKKDIENKLVIIPAFKEGKTNLIDNWLSPAENKTLNDDARFVIKHYKALLNNLTIDIMDNKDIINTLVRDENFYATMDILENSNSICDSVVDDFLEDLEKQVKLENLGVCKRLGKGVEISLNNASWKYVIEYYPSNNQYWRYILYHGDKELPEIKKIWPKVDTGMPFGWDYFDEAKGWCYWDRPETLRAMHNGTFLSYIIEELKDAVNRIGMIQL